MPANVGAAYRAGTPSLPVNTHWPVSRVVNCHHLKGDNKQTHTHTDRKNKHTHPCLAIHAEQLDLVRCHLRGSVTGPATAGWGCIWSSCNWMWCNWMLGNWIGLNRTGMAVDGVQLEELQLECLLAVNRNLQKLLDR